MFKRVVRQPLFWLAALYVAIGVLYALSTPMLEKPDEEGRYGYVVYLRQQRALPPLEPSASMLLFESKQPPLYYALTALLTSWLPDVPDPEQLLVTNPYLDFSVPGYRNDNRNVYLHPPDMTPLFLGARMVSLLLGLGTWLVTYSLARAVYPGRSRVPIATAAVAGFQPAFRVMATALNNDVAVAFLGAVTVRLLILRAQGGERLWLTMSLGAVVGLAALTKVSGLVFVPLVVLALLLIYRRPRWSMARELALLSAIALAVGGWWYARNALLYNDPLTLRSHTAALGGAARPLWESLRRDLMSIEHTLWANPARSFVSPIALDQALLWWGRLSLVLAGVGLARRFRAQRPAWAVWAILLSWPLTFMILLVGYWTRQSSWTFGRFLLPSIAPMALLFVAGWHQALLPRWRRWGLTLSAGVVISASSVLPLVSLYPLYHPSREGAITVQHPLDLRYVDAAGTPIVRLLGYTLPQPETAPGEYVPVELCWQPLDRTAAPYAVFVHLLDTSPLQTGGLPAIWGARETYPGLGNRPTDRWALDVSFCDRVLVRASPDAPAPLCAAIEVGLVDPKSGDLLQPVDAAGDPVELALAGRAPILARGVERATHGQAHYVLDDAIALDQLQVRPQRADSVTLTLTWRSLRAVSYEAVLFAHLVDEAGNVVAQVDHPPLGGRFPTSCWQPGQIVDELVSVPLSPEARQRAVALRLGMYLWPSLQRLPVSAGGTRLQNDVIVQTLPAAR